MERERKNERQEQCNKIISEGCRGRMVQDKQYKCNFGPGIAQERRYNQDNFSPCFLAQLERKKQESISRRILLRLFQIYPVICSSHLGFTFGMVRKFNIVLVAYWNIEMIASSHLFELRETPLLKSFWIGRATLQQLY